MREGKVTKPKIKVGQSYRRWGSEEMILVDRLEYWENLDKWVVLEKLRTNSYRAIAAELLVIERKK